jgi:hypothetical protein
MSRYEASVTNAVEGRSSRYEGRRPATKATLEVRPPFVIGEGFQGAVLGKDQNGIHVEHVFTTDDVTTFAVEAALYGSETRQHMIDRVGVRIGELLNGERDAVTMMAENPFPHPRTV